MYAALADSQTDVGFFSMFGRGSYPIACVFYFFHWLNCASWDQKGGIISFEPRSVNPSLRSNEKQTTIWTTLETFGESVFPFHRGMVGWVLCKGRNTFWDELPCRLTSQNSHRHTLKILWRAFTARVEAVGTARKFFHSWHEIEKAAGVNVCSSFHHIKSSSSATCYIHVPRFGVLSSSFPKTAMNGW